MTPDQARMLSRMIELLPLFEKKWFGGCTPEEEAEVDAFMRDGIDWIRAHPAEEPGPMETILMRAPELPHRFLPGGDFPTFCHICGAKAADKPHHR